MFKCCYCGRLLKHQHMNCPGCGSSEVVYADLHGTFEVKDSPLGGYCSGLLKNENFDHYINWFYLGVGILALLIPIKFFIFDYPYFKELGKLPSSFNISLTFCVILFTIVGIGNIIRSLKRGKHIRNKIKINKNLAQKGILVKNLPYFTNEAGIYKYVYIKYTINGNEKIFKSQIPYSEAQLTSDGTFDLLYDPNNSKNYYVDTEIY